MITDKITLLNETVLKCLYETDEINIVKAFALAGIKVLGADFGFVWLNLSSPEKWELIYKTPNLPFRPKKPRANGRNFKAITSGKIEYVKNLKNTPDATYVSKYMKSFVIIPISYRGKAYGTIVLCFKQPEPFLDEKKILSIFLGNGVAQAINS